VVTETKTLQVGRLSSRNGLPINRRTFQSKQEVTPCLPFQFPRTMPHGEFGCFTTRQRQSAMTYYLACADSLFDAYDFIANRLSAKIQVLFRLWTGNARVTMPPKCAAANPAIALRLQFTLTPQSRHRLRFQRKPY